jgi:uncharacterized membrane protein YeaQ/YmgE (transglycosylase-associated protein family)
MNVLVWLLIGSGIGWLGDRLTAENERRVALHIGVGIAGALAGGWLVVPLISQGVPHRISMLGVATALLGALASLALVRGGLRQ